MSKATKEKSSQVAQSAATVSHGKSTETTLRDLTKAFADVHTILLALQQEVREIKHNLAQQNKAISAPSVIAKESLVSGLDYLIRRIFIYILVSSKTWTNPCCGMHLEIVMSHQSLKSMH